MVFMLSVSLVVGAPGSSPKDARAQSGGATRRISIGLYGREANGGSSFPAISADGRFVAFHSYATNLVTGDTNNWADVSWHGRRGPSSGAGEASRRFRDLEEVHHVSNLACHHRAPSSRPGRDGLWAEEETHPCG